MSELQILQNKAAKVMLSHRCIAIHKCLIGETDFNFNFTKNQAVHSYNTRRSNDIRLPPTIKFCLKKTIQYKYYLQFISIKKPT